MNVENPWVLVTKNKNRGKGVLVSQTSSPGKSSNPPKVELDNLVIKKNNVYYQPFKDGCT